MVFSLRKQMLFGFLVLLVYSGHYALLNTATLLNEYGRKIEEWPLLFDTLLFLPLLYYLIFRPGLKDFLFKTTALCIGGIGFGSFAIPDESKILWQDLENVRPYLAGLMVIAEFTLVGWLVYQTWKLLRISGDVDAMLERQVIGGLGDSPISRIILFDARIWFYGLLLKKNKTIQYEGEQHFGYAQNGGNASNQLGFIFLIIFEIPLGHALLHFLAAPAVAWLISALTVFGLLYLLAEYRATLRRPISLGRDALLLRCGLFAPDARIPYAMLAAAEPLRGPVPRERGTRRLEQMGEPNVELRLRPGSELRGFLGGMQPVQRIYLGLDRPQAFLAALQARLAQIADEK
ncbi:hypothetical protein [Massilia sp. BJB1822]|uniref:hypothetical protein n=1 Tax=Massilia sp. BJB1822 TaxID=2744470 RepID=UPI001594A4A6|nr:hypothetical protein [Massilia sp. BJB1822]NVD98952.1 hypothetical protein [Massilia sp. BJB1822]